MSVLLPSSTLPQVRRRSSSFFWWRARYAWMSSSPRSTTCISEVPLALLLLHRPRLVVVDHPALPLGVPREEHLLDDLRQCRRAALDRPRERVAAQRAEPHPLHHRLLAGPQRHPLVVHHDERAVALDDRADVGEVERHDGNVLQVDVLPDVQFGPVAQREGANALTLVHLAVVQVPELRPLVLRVPLVQAVAEAVNALLGPALLLVATGTAERRVELVVVQRLLQRRRLHNVGVFFRAVVEWVDVLGSPLRVDPDLQVEALFATVAIAELDHRPELPGRVDVQQREG